MLKRTFGAGVAALLALLNVGAANAETIGSAARAIPEPSTLLLFGLGVALLGAAMLLRRRSG